MSNGIGASPEHLSQDKRLPEAHKRFIHYLTKETS